MKNLTTLAQVTDTNHRNAGMQLVSIEVLNNGEVFSLVIGGQVFYRTCKQGESFGRGATSAPAGTMMFEMEAEDFSRAWVDADAKFVHLD